MREMQKQFRIINAVGSIYKLNLLIHLDTGEWEAIKMPGEVGAVLQKQATAKLCWKATFRISWDRRIGALIKSLSICQTWMSV